MREGATSTATYEQDPPAPTATAAARPDIATTNAPAVEGALPAQEITVRLFDDRIEMPATIGAGTTTFNIRNDGTRALDFYVQGRGTRASSDGPLAPGATGTVEIDLQPGRYEVRSGTSTWDLNVT